LKFNGQIGEVVADWQTIVRPDDAEQLTSAIASAVEERSVATKDISENAHMAARVNETLATNIASANRAITLTKESSGTVLSASEHLAAEADRLARAVAKFFDDLRSGGGREVAPAA